MINPYAILGVSKEAGEDAIKKAYRKLAKKYHPDVNRNNPAAERKFKEISEAYRILSDKSARRAYDEEARKTAADEETSRRREERRRRRKAGAPGGGAFDIANMAQGLQGNFERYFGFDPQTGEITREDKLNMNAKKKKNPLDTTALFESFFSGVKK